LILAFFYTFKTKEGYEVSLTPTHNIPVFISEENEIKFLPASKVTLKHRLIMFGQKVEMKNISTNSRQGYYAPLTLSGYLLVNNISTSIFSNRYVFRFILKKSQILFFSHASPNTLQCVFAPIRAYYHIMRWMFGKSYDPFKSNVKEGFHPIAAFLKRNDFLIRVICYTAICTFSILLIILTHKIFNKK
jgi:hypothetical protein